MPESMITKRALAAALKDLMNEEALSKITVGDICDHCGMSRKGFYYHFKDKFDLVNWIFYTEFVEHLQTKAYTTSWDFLDDICQYFYENRSFYINAFQVEGQNSFTEYFTEIIQPLALDYFKRTYEGGAHFEFFSMFFTDAFRIAIMRWLKEKTKLKPDEFVGLLRQAASSVSQKIAAEEETPAQS